MSKSTIISTVAMLLSLVFLISSMFVNEHMETVLLLLAIILYQYHLSARIQDIEEYHQNAMLTLMKQSENWTTLLEGLDKEAQRRKLQEEEKHRQEEIEKLTKTRFK